MAHFDLLLIWFILFQIWLWKINNLTYTQVFFEVLHKLLNLKDTLENSRKNITRITKNEQKVKVDHENSANMQ